MYATMVFAATDFFLFVKKKKNTLNPKLRKILL